MTEAHYTWDGPGALARVQNVAWEGLVKAALYLHTRLVEVLAVPNTGERRLSRWRRTPSGRAASYTVYPHPSRPGEPPRLRTGFLQRNVRYELDRARRVARVGITRNARYGLYLERGTARVQARPWLVATVEKHLGKLRGVATGA